MPIIHHRLGECWIIISLCTEFSQAFPQGYPQYFSQFKHQSLGKLIDDDASGDADIHGVFGT